MTNVHVRNDDPGDNNAGGQWGEPVNPEGEGGGGNWGKPTPAEG